MRIGPRNAAKSTGPNNEEGKRRSRQNAVRHGLCVETVVELVEDVDDYGGFEAAVIADYDARTAVERELVLRLASLLWRLRRIISIETDLLTIQSDIVHERRAVSVAPAREPSCSDTQLAPFIFEPQRTEAANDEEDALPVSVRDLT